MDQRNQQQYERQYQQTPYDQGNWNYTPPQPPYYGPYGQRWSQKSRLVALLLCVLVGGLGIHRFYVGKIGTGILWLFTGGCFGIGCLVDLIMIITGDFTDGTGAVVKRWDD